MEGYRMTVHLFGAVSSPACSVFVLRKTASDNEKEFGPLVVKTIKRNFYVDDCLKSRNDTLSTVNLINDLRQSCAKGSIRLTNFCSNSRVVLQSTPEEERSKELRNLDLQHERLPVERALDVYWNTESDYFEFRVTLNSKPATRRGMQSVVSPVYDPLGFVAHSFFQQRKFCRNFARKSN